MEHTYTTSIYKTGRQAIAVALSILLVPLTSGVLGAQPAYPPAAYAPMDAQSLDQLVAPIALYPDALVAQILTASTYPQQVSDADNWSRQNASLPPEERADIANGMPWDPSIKSLTAFPSVLEDLARNYNWTVSLGNAYYNQPGDVMNAVQAARYQAQQAGYLRSTSQQRVYYNDGQILIAPVNPEVVYVPYYNPWRIYGGWISPWPGYYVAPAPRGFGTGLAIGFIAGISIGLFAHYGWGYHHWEPDWRGGVVVYNHNTYISRSTTVYNNGHFGEHNRGVFEREGRGVPRDFRPPVTARTANFGRDRNFAPRPDAVRPQPARPPVTQYERDQNGRGQFERGQEQRNQPRQFERGQEPQNQPRQFERGQEQRNQPQRNQPAPGQFERGQAQRGQGQRVEPQRGPAERVQPQRGQPPRAEGGNRPQQHEGGKQEDRGQEHGHGDHDR